MSHAPAHGAPSRSPQSWAVRVLLGLVLAVVLVASTILLVGQLLPGSERVKIALAFVWLGGLGIAIGKAVKERPDLRIVTRTAILLAAVAIGGWYLVSLRGKDVQEELVSVPAPSPPSARGGETARGKGAASPGGPALIASGSFAALDHPGEGSAEVIRQDGRLTLQLRDFDTDAGPDLRVYLATATNGSEFVDLGSLKGDSGNQSYEVPAGTDTQKYDTALIWCRAFSVGFTAAPLKAG